MNYAGQFLKIYEQKRYKWYERYLPSITVPRDAFEFPDESFWGGEIDFDKFSKARAVIFRLGQGTVKDARWERNYEEAKEHGMAVGAYHFYDGRTTPMEQTEFIVDTLRGKTLEMELIADWERNYGRYDGIHNVVSVMRGVENRVVAKDVGLYTGYYWFLENSKPALNRAEYEYLKNKPLWIAWYASAAFVKVPPPWSNWTHWQYGTPSRGEEFGVKKIEIDMNRHNGTESEFVARYGGPTQSPTISANLSIHDDGTVTGTWEKQ